MERLKPVTAKYKQLISDHIQLKSYLFKLLPA